MLTVIGKNLVYLTVILSITGLGLSLWSAADRTDFKRQADTLNSEIRKLTTARQVESEDLKTLLNQLAVGSRNIPRGPDELAANKDINVAAANKEAADIETQLKDLANKLQIDVQGRNTLFNEMQALRQKVQTEKDIGRDLRLIVTPDENLQRQGQRSFWDTVSSLQVAKDEAERRTEAMQPDLYNAAIRLQSLEMRLKGLRERAKELGIR
jgi:hypothetical protein